MDHSTKFHELITSRMNHDLANPLGAIGNGLELLELAGLSDNSPEFHLVKDSLIAAQAKLRLMRVAFGDVIDTDDIQSVWASCQRCELNIIGAAPSPRQIKTIVLAAMCVESALPMCGDITVNIETQMTVHATGRRVMIKPDLWGVFTDAAGNEIGASDVHFSVLAGYLETMDQTLGLTHDDTSITIQIA